MRAKNLFGDRRGVAQIIGFLIVTSALFGIVTYVLVAKGQQAEMKAQGLIDVMREAEARQREFISLVYAENDNGQIKVYLYNYGTENVRLDENNLFIENTRVSATHRLTGVAFSWSYSDPDGDPQVKYRVQVSDRSDFGNIIWDTGEVASSDSLCQYGGPGLTEGTTYYIRVNLYDGYEWTGWLTGSFVT